MKKIDIDEKINEKFFTERGRVVSYNFLGNVYSTSIEEPFFIHRKKTPSIYLEISNCLHFSELVYKLR